MPVFALPSDYGIGGFSKAAYTFVDKMELAGIKMWQMLPLGPTGYGDSPYQSFSTYAGNPYMIDLETLIQKGLLTADECQSKDCGQQENRINYSKIYLTRFELLRIAFRRFQSSFIELAEEQQGYQTFLDQNKDWLDDYCLYTAIKNEQQGKPWNQWPYELKTRNETALEEARHRLNDQIEFNRFLQYEFFVQWDALHAYAKKKNVQLIGDIPFYVSMDSSDIWANTELFQLTKNCEPIAVAGCPPDGFTPKGQLWGNPLYDWDRHKKDGYQWWIKRILFQLQWYDILRVDHFRGFDEYYAIPYGQQTAEYGQWEKGPGIDLFQQLDQKYHDIPIIAEDLGFLTDHVRKLVSDTGFPGMKILQFAFDIREKSDYLPYNYEKNCVVYTGTHDNNTIAGWYRQLDWQTQNYIREYLGVNQFCQNCAYSNCENVDAQIHWEFIRLALASVADYCVIPLQDFLGMGEEGRINIPSTLGNNWSWKLKQKELDALDTDRIRKMVVLYGRC